VLNERDRANVVHECCSFILLPIYLIKTNKSLKRKGFAIRRQDSDQIGSTSDTVGLDLDMFGISVFAMKL
jgi:hypothetical protein